MAFSRYKGVHRKKIIPDLDMVVSSLKKENVLLKKTLSELCRQQSEHNKLVERFLSVEGVTLDRYQQLTAKYEKVAVMSEQLSEIEGELMDKMNLRSERRVFIYSREIEEIRNKLVTISTRCQYLEDKVAGKEDSSGEASANTVTELQKHLSHALEMNKRWLEYDQQREAYVRAVLDRMLWLEKQLNEASQACSQQHNKEHSDEKDQISQMQEHYERLVRKTEEELEMLREEFETTQQSLISTQNWCKEKEREAGELNQQQQTEKMNQQSTPVDHQCSEDEEQQLEETTSDFNRRLDEERRRSASLELQANICQKFLLNRHHADQEKITDLQKKIKIASQDLEDERQDCSYLKEQMVKVLKRLRKTKNPETKQSKNNEQDHSSGEAACQPPTSHTISLPSSPRGSVLNESFLECPSCRAEYPASHYRELMNHLEICVD